MISTPSSASVGGVGIWGGSLNVSTNPEIILYQNFIDAPSLASWLTLSRLSTATYFDSSMLLKDAAQDNARFDNYYDAASSSVKKRGLLLEKQSTNYAKSNLDAYMTTLTTSTEGNINFTTISGTTDNNEHYATSSPSALTGSRTQVWSLVLNGIPTLNQIGIRPIVFGSSVRDWPVYFNVDSNANVSLATKNPNITDYKISKLSNVFNSLSIKYATPTDMTSLQIRIMLKSGLFISSSTDKLTVGLIQLEDSQYKTSFIKTTTTAVTRAADNIQLNVTNYTGSVKLIYERQDTNVIETKWLELTNQTNPVLSSNLDVGIWLQSIAIYNRILTAQEKTNA